MIKKLTKILDKIMGFDKEEAMIRNINKQIEERSKLLDEYMMMTGLSTPSQKKKD